MKDAEFTFQPQRIYLRRKPLGGWSNSSKARKFGSMIFRMKFIYPQSIASCWDGEVFRLFDNSIWSDGGIINRFCFRGVWWRVRSHRAPTEFELCGHEGSSTRFFFLHNTHFLIYYYCWFPSVFFYSSFLGSRNIINSVVFYTNDRPPGYVSFFTEPSRTVEKLTSILPPKWRVSIPPVRYPCPR